MKKLDYLNLSSTELKDIINKKQKEIKILNNYYEDVKLKEHEEKYETVRVDGCKGCGLEHYDYCNEHCEGWHIEERLRKH